MKKNSFLSFAAATAVVLIIATAGMITSCTHEDIPGTSKTATEGRIVVNGNSYLIIEGNAPISMYNKGNADMFAGLTTGDLIRIVRNDEVRESYPGQVDVYECTKLEDGEPTDIPEGVRATLIDLGWMKVMNTSETESEYDLGVGTDSYINESALTTPVSYSYGYANMSLRVPEGWEYKVTEYKDGSTPFGITLWPEHKPDATLELMYYPAGFGVCGTGLTVTETEVILDGRSASMGFYDSSQFWSFIACEDYAMVNHMQDGTFGLYRDDIELIVGSVVICDGVVSRDEAIAAVSETVTYEHTAEADFDYEIGTWEVKLYIGDTYNTLALTAEVDASGKVTTIEEWAIVD